MPLHNTVSINRTKIQIHERFKFVSVNFDGEIRIHEKRPVFSDGFWEGGNPKRLGTVTFDTQEMHTKWKIDDDEGIIAFLTGFCSQMMFKLSDGLKLDYLFKNSALKTWTADHKLYESKLNENDISLVDGDKIEIPNGYKYLAIDANGGIFAFKGEPSLTKSGEFAQWEGSGKSQVGVAVWDFSKLEGKPSEFEEAKSKIAEILDDFKFEITDGLDLGDELRKTNQFKIIFPKYEDIENL